MVDILILSRLFRANRRLWIGEWIFHLSFFMVILRHLRYVLNPVPEWISSLQPAGIFGGYVLPFSLLYILTVKIANEKEKYISILNFFLLGILLLISITGLLMRTIMRPDIVQIKHFAIGLFGFAPGLPPESWLFYLHFIMVFFLLVCLPTHIFAAPFSVLYARERKDGLKLLMHGK
jgi:nitrate reductase gamma subunit